MQRNMSHYKEPVAVGVAGDSNGRNKGSDRSKLKVSMDLNESKKKKKKDKKDQKDKDRDNLGKKDKKKKKKAKKKKKGSSSLEKIEMETTEEDITYTDTEGEMREDEHKAETTDIEVSELEPHNSRRSSSKSNNSLSTRNSLSTQNSLRSSTGNCEVPQKYKMIIIILMIGILYLMYYAFFPTCPQYRLKTSKISPPSIAKKGRKVKSMKIPSSSISMKVPNDDCQASDIHDGGMRRKVENNQPYIQNRERWSKDEEVNCDDYD